MNTIGFHAVQGFDHRVRVVVDAPANQHGQRLVAYKDGCRVVRGFMLVPAALDAIPANCDGDNWQDQAEAMYVADWIKSLPLPASDAPHAIDA
jgi:hypothetical protein